MAHDGVYNYMRKIFALPFLPSEHIQDAFTKLADKASNDALRSLCDYIRTTWINNTVWPTESWSVFNQSVRTNNDVEGWHRRLNYRAANGKPPFYVLIMLLDREARLLRLQAKLVREGKLQRYQRKAAKSTQGMLFKLWDQYVAGTRSTSKLLKACGKIYAPVVEASPYIEAIVPDDA